MSPTALKLCDEHAANGIRDAACIRRVGEECRVCGRRVLELRRTDFGEGRVVDVPIVGTLTPAEWVKARV